MRRASYLLLLFVTLAVTATIAVGQPPEPPPPAIFIQRGAPAGAATQDVVGVTAGVAGAGLNGSAQDKGPRTEQQKIRLQGHVLSATGEPLRKANVSLLPGAIAGMDLPVGAFNLSQLAANMGGSATTDDTGGFTLDDVNPGNYQLMADHAGYITQRYGARTAGAPGTPLTLKEGDKLTKLDITLTPQSVITGRVLDRDGDPVVGIQVTASRYVYNGGKRDLRAEGTNGTTDDRGVYRVSTLVPGHYYVQAQPQKNVAAGKEAAANVATYYPSALELRSATPVSVAPGDEITNTTIRLRFEKVHSIRGTVINASTGAPLSGISVMVQPPEGNSPQATDLVRTIVGSRVQSDKDGKFEIRGLVSGGYRLFGNQGGSISIVSGSGNGGFMFRTAASLAKVNSNDAGLSGNVSVNVGSEDAVTILRVGNGATITGTMHIENGSLEELLKAAPPVRTAPADGPPLALMAGGLTIRLTTTQSLAINPPNGRVQDNGSFELTGVASATYYLALNPPPGYYMKSATFSGQDITRSPLDFSAGGGGQLDIVLAKGTGKISGTVTDKEGQTLSGVSVTLWPQTPTQSSTTGGVRTATTDQNGAFQFAEVAPGDYRVAAFAELPEPGLGQFAPFLFGFNDTATRVKLTENGTESPQITPIGRDKIQAEVAKLP